MKYAIVFQTKTGNTLMLAEKIQTVLPKEDCVYFGEPNETALQADFLYCGFWTDKGTCPNEMKDFLQKVHNRSIFLFGTAGFGADEAYFDKIMCAVCHNLDETVHVAGTYMCQGKMPVAVRQRYEKMEDSPKKQMLIENFDAALEHPSNADLEVFVNRVLAKNA